MPNLGARTGSHEFGRNMATPSPKAFDQRSTQFYCRCLSESRRIVCNSILQQNSHRHERNFASRTSCKEIGPRFFSLASIRHRRNQLRGHRGKLPTHPSESQGPESTGPPRLSSSFGRPGPQSGVPDPHDDHRVHGRPCPVQVGFHHILTA